MATDQEPIAQTVQDYSRGWYDADTAPMGRAPRPGDTPTLIRTGDGWKMADPLWLPR